jgi:hypothetical protein
MRYVVYVCCSLGARIAFVRLDGARQPGISVISLTNSLFLSFFFVVRIAKHRHGSRGQASHVECYTAGISQSDSDFSQPFDGGD